MKLKIYFLLVFPILVSAQSKVKFFNEVNIAYTVPNQLENTFLKEGFKNNFGFFSEFEHVTYKKFGFINGFQINKYNVTNSSVAGNAKNATLQTIHLKLVYHLKVTNKINIDPYVGYGFIEFRNINKTYGNSYILGTNFNYNLYKKLSLLVGVQYNATQYDITTNAAEKLFFNSSNNLQLNIGLNFRFRTLD
jgi:hypothetical protein